jgi:uncharacterized cupredoxin-like copper-binding protein
MHSIRNAALTAVAAAAGAGASLVAVTAAPAGAASSTTTVKAVETDFHIALSKKTFTAGRYVFLVVNKGQTTHALEITGPGLSNATTKNIQHGQTTRLTVTLKKGVYDVFCPVPGHKMLGMNMNISVAGISVGAASATTRNGSKSAGSSNSSSTAAGGGAAF